MILRAGQRGRGAPRLREMGARLRGDRPGHRDRPAGAAHARRDRGRHPGRAAGRPRRRSTSGRGRGAIPSPRSTRPPARRATRSTACSASSPRPTSPRSAGSGSSTTTSCRATRSSGRAATPRWSGIGDTGKALALDDRLRRRAIAAPIRYAAATQAVAESWRNLTAVGARAAGADRQHEFRQPGEARDHGRVRRRHRGHARGVSRARLPGRLRQCVALQRDQRQRDPADAGDRRRRADRRRARCGRPRAEA